MIRLVLIIVAAMVTGAIIHIATIFSVPYFAKNDVWHRALTLGPLHRIHTISDPKEAVDFSTDLDPFFAYGLCRADLSVAPVVLKGQLASDFWSLNYLDRQGRSQFSVTNQISGPRVNIVLATKGQQRLLTERPDMIDETSIVISATEDKGLLFLRAFVGSERDRGKVLTAISKLDCAPLWDEEGQ